MGEKKFYIVIKVDIEDADYNISFNPISTIQLKRITPLIEQIKKFKPYKGKTESGFEITHKHNYPYNDCCIKELGEKSISELYSNVDKEIIREFENLLPFCEYDFHTIVSIELIPYEETIKLI